MPDEAGGRRLVLGGRARDAAGPAPLVRLNPSALLPRGPPSPRLAPSPLAVKNGSSPSSPLSSWRIESLRSEGPGAAPEGPYSRRAGELTFEGGAVEAPAALDTDERVRRCGLGVGDEAVRADEALLGCGRAAEEGGVDASWAGRFGVGVVPDSSVGEGRSEGGGSAGWSMARAVSPDEVDEADEASRASAGVGGGDMVAGLAAGTRG